MSFTNLNLYIQHQDQLGLVGGKEIASSSVGRTEQVGWYIVMVVQRRVVLMNVRLMFKSMVKFSEF